MDFTLTPLQQDLVARAAAVARDSLAPRAAMYDASGDYPRESWHDLWQQGFLGMVVPTAYGGLGLDMPSYVLGETSDAVQRAVLAARAKYLATEAALMITSKAVQIVGGRSAHRKYPLERLFRDIRTATLMPPNVDRSMELIGKAALGVGDEAILARHAG